MKRLLLICSLVVLVLLELSCAGDGLIEDSEANVYLVVTSYDYGDNPVTSISNYYVPVCLGVDVFIEQLVIESRARNPAKAPDNGDDVLLTRWEVTPYRLDGGTPSPVWVRDFEIHVPVLGTATLDSHNVYPAEYFLEPPLIYLFPENGGYDPETGLTMIRQSLKIEFFGKTTNGRNVSVSTVKEFQFACSF
jgi:hypothetical protein